MGATRFGLYFIANLKISSDRRVRTTKERNEFARRNDHEQALHRWGVLLQDGKQKRRRNGSRRGVLRVRISSSEDSATSDRVRVGSGYWVIEYQ